MSILVHLPEGDTVWGGVVDVGAPETYDLRLYPVPRADSVPEKEFEECMNKAGAVLQALKTAEGGVR